jgi:hypothetical protein
MPHVKVAQADALCARLAAFAKEHAPELGQGQVPLVVGGDFNSLPVKRRSDYFDTVCGCGVCCCGERMAVAWCDTAAL